MLCDPIKYLGSKIFWFEIKSLIFIDPETVNIKFNLAIKENHYERSKINMVKAPFYRFICCRHGWRNDNTGHLGLQVRKR